MRTVFLVGIVRDHGVTPLTTLEMDFFILSTLVIFVPKGSLLCGGYPREQACLCVRRSIRIRDTSHELTLLSTTVPPNHFQIMLSVKNKVG